ncbi:DNA topoisomerase IB [Mesonia aestuariivivens]|uniref:DNA topoisomerase IB n=1 Tax=Mesonia aestuariivivens TaxID=2796128 RepID=A0ABS6VZQ0_9FLAO|nr:DNA topoisomerase IB [Mesonia aestuariivivens]MBW2961075.1 DNA topoisomerase IB [Mesonia aestuariivivens]
MNLTAEKIEKITQHPEEFAALANLVYIQDHQLTIQRHKHGKGFYYTDKNKKKITQKNTLERFKKLVIPPAWNEVRITHLTNGHLQVVGRDDKNRKVYRYHDLWSKFKNQTKFFKMSSFGKKLPEIRKQVDKDLELEGMPKQKVLALVVRLMEETHIRIGNHYYAKKNQTYGLSTLRSRHVNLSEDILTFNFIGKKGKEHHINVTDKDLIELVNECEEIPGWELFKYYDEDGQKNSIDSGMINEYIQNICGEYYSAKDFRTWAATKIYFEALRDLGYTDKEKQQDKNLIAALDEAAEGLGNTRSVCKNYYVHPVVTEYYQDGKIQEYFDKVDEEATKNSTSLFSNTEKVVLELMENFKINLKEKKK